MIPTYALVIGLIVIVLIFLIIWIARDYPSQDVKRKLWDQGAQRAVEESYGGWGAWKCIEIFQTSGPLSFEMSVMVLEKHHERITVMKPKTGEVGKFYRLRFLTQEERKTTHSCWVGIVDRYVEAELVKA